MCCVGWSHGDSLKYENAMMLCHQGRPQSNSHHCHNHQQAFVAGVRGKVSVGASLATDQAAVCENGCMIGIGIMVG